MALQNENEQLRCQLKLYQIQNELSKEHYLLKKTPTSAGALNINHLLPLQNQKSCSSPSSSASPSSTNNTHSSTKANTNTSNNQILQNLLLLQQQQQQHSSSKIKINCMRLQQQRPNRFRNIFSITIHLA